MMLQGMWVGLGLTGAAPVAANAAEAERLADALSAGELLRWSSGLIAVLALILALAWILKKIGPYSSPVGRGLKVVGGLSLGVREKLVLVQVGRKQLLLGVAPGRVETLYVLADDEVLSVMPENRDGLPFSERLQQLLGGRQR